MVHKAMTIPTLLTVVALTLFLTGCINRSSQQPGNSAAAEFSIERRKGVNSAPAYMVADVTSMSTPTPLTFIVHLDKPVSAFLDYLAAPYGPKMVSPPVPSIVAEMVPPVKLV